MSDPNNSDVQDEKAKKFGQSVADAVKAAMGSGSSSSTGKDSDSPAAKGQDPHILAALLGDGMAASFVSRVAGFFGGLVGAKSSTTASAVNRFGHDTSPWNDDEPDSLGDKAGASGKSRKGRVQRAVDAAMDKGEGNSTTGESKREANANRFPQSLWQQKSRPGTSARPAGAEDAPRPGWRGMANRAASFGEKWGGRLKNSAKWLQNEVGGDFGHGVGNVVDSLGNVATKGAKFVRTSAGAADAVGNAAGAARTVGVAASAAEATGAAASAGTGAVAAGEGALMGLGAEGGPVGLGLAALAVGATEVATAMVKVVTGVHDFSDSLLQAKRANAAVNGQVAMSYMQFDADRYGRQVRSAAETADSTQGLTQSQSRLEEAMLPWQNATDNVTNRVTQVVQNGVASLLEGFNTVISDAVKEVRKQFGLKNPDKQQDIQLPLSEILSRLGNGERFDQRRQKPLANPNKKGK